MSVPPTCPLRIVLTCEKDPDSGTPGKCFSHQVTVDAVPPTLSVSSASRQANRPQNRMLNGAPFLFPLNLVALLHQGVERYDRSHLLKRHQPQMP